MHVITCLALPTLRSAARQLGSQRMLDGTSYNRLLLAKALRACRTRLARGAHHATI